MYLYKQLWLVKNHMHTYKNDKPLKNIKVEKTKATKTKIKKKTQNKK